MIKNKLERKKTFHHSKALIKRIIKFRKYLPSVTLSLKSWFSEAAVHRCFFKIGVVKNFAIFTGKNLCWPLHAFFYRTPTLAASGFSRQQILFSAESGIYCWQSHLFLPRTPVETRVKRQKQPRKLLCKKRCF